MFWVIWLGRVMPNVSHTSQSIHKATEVRSSHFPFLRKWHLQVKTSQWKIATKSHYNPDYNRQDSYCTHLSHAISQYPSHRRHERAGKRSFGWRDLDPVFRKVEDLQMRPSIPRFMGCEKQGGRSTRKNSADYKRAEMRAEFLIRKSGINI